MRDLPGWLAALVDAAPDLVVPFRALDEGGPLAVRREVRRRAAQGSVARLLPQHRAIADAYEACLRALPDTAFALPGGEADWTVAEALGHAFESRQGLALAAALAAAGRWPPGAPVVVPGVPGPAGAGREALLGRLATSRRLVERASRSIAGHELERCPLEHPLVGHLRCGEWFLFAGVHDLMHLEQLAALAAGLAPTSEAGFGTGATGRGAAGAREGGAGARAAGARGAREGGTGAPSIAVREVAG